MSFVDQHVGGVVVSLLYCFMPFVQCGYLYCLCYVIFRLFYFHDK